MIREGKTKNCKENDNNRCLPQGYQKEITPNISNNNKINNRFINLEKK